MPRSSRYVRRSRSRQLKRRGRSMKSQTKRRGRSRSVKSQTKRRGRSRSNSYDSWFDALRPKCLPKKKVILRPSDASGSRCIDFVIEKDNGNLSRPHRIVIYTYKGGEKAQLLIEKPEAEMRLFKGCYDTSRFGHVTDVGGLEMSIAKSLFSICRRQDNRPCVLPERLLYEMLRDGGLTDKERSNIQLIFAGGY